VGSKLIGVLPTYRRQHLIADAVERIRRQTRPPDHVVVVDNEGSAETEAIVRGLGADVEYLGMAENMGFAGGVAAGMRRVLEFAGDDDWIVIVDDDDPPRFDDALERLERLAEECTARDPRTAAVGISGGWFDWRRGRMRRVPDAELVGAVPVDHVAGNCLPCFRVAAVRAVGPFCDEIFFGLSELEFGLRLWRAGYTLYGHGEMWLASRTATGRLNRVLRPDRGLAELNWRRYYTTRNLIFILRRFDHTWTAVRVTFVPSLAKPFANLFVHPRDAARHLGLSLRAVRDGWTGRMGRRVEPDGARRPLKGVFGRAA
jgi:glycosyltransferase involved in cell wall biosynthesis